MRKITVFEKIMTRKTNIIIGPTSRSEWEEQEGSFEEVCNRVEKELTAIKDCYLEVQVAKFFYDENNNEIGWNSGKSCYRGKWH